MTPIAIARETVGTSCVVPVRAQLINAYSASPFAEGDATGLLAAAPEDWVRGLPHRFFRLINDSPSSMSRWTTQPVLDWLNSIGGGPWAALTGKPFLAASGISHTGWSIRLTHPTSVVWFCSTHPNWTLDLFIADSWSETVTFGDLLRQVSEQVQALEQVTHYFGRGDTLTDDQRATIRGALRVPLSALARATAPYRHLAIDHTNNASIDLRLTETILDTGLYDAVKVMAYRSLGMSSAEIVLWESGEYGQVPSLTDLRVLRGLR